MFSLFRKSPAKTPNVFRGPAGDYLISQDVIGKSTPEAMNYVESAKSAVKDKNFNRAISDYQRAAEIDPQWWFPQSQIGVLLDAQGDIVNATRFFERTVELRPDWSPSYFNLGNYKKLAKQYESALKLFLKCVSLDPKDTGALLQVALCYSHMGLVSEENRYYEFIFELTKSCSIAHFNYAINHLADKNIASAREHLQLVMRQEPKGSALHNLAAAELGRC